MFNVMTVFGTHPEAIITETTRLLKDREEYGCMAHISNPFGDGRTAQRIVDFIRNTFINEKNTGGMSSHASKTRSKQN